MGKRVFDVVIALFGIILLTPLLVIVACGVLCSGQGPIVYRGMRIGRHGKPFFMLKFRTMRPAKPDEAEVTVLHDPRVTRFGQFLRATKIDETLQLINVLRGEMSLVGPRPLSYRYIKYYAGPASDILTVRPGITGMVQLQFRREEALFVGENPEGFYVNVVLPYKQFIELTYVHGRSFWGDMRILFLTALVLVHPLPPPVIPTPAAQPAPTAERELAAVFVGDARREG